MYSAQCSSLRQNNPYLPAPFSCDTIATSRGGGSQMKEEIRFDASELHAEGIVAAVVRSFKLEEVSLDACAAAVKALIIALATVILMLIKRELNITGDLQEYIDKLTYQAKMDSSNSSSRPSSDMPWGKNGGKGEKETTNNGKAGTNGKKNPAGLKKSTDLDTGKESQDSEDADADNFEEEEGKSEKELRANHDRSLRVKTGRPVGKQVGSKKFLKTLSGTRLSSSLRTSASIARTGRNALRSIQVRNVRRTTSLT